MSTKISYKIKIQSVGIQDANNGLAFGKSAYSPEVSPVLYQRPVNSTNFTDGIVNPYTVEETDRHIKMSSNFLIRQGSLVKNKIHGISLTGEKTPSFQNMLASIGEYKQFVKGKKFVYSTRIHENAFDVADGQVEGFVFKRKRGRISVHSSAMPYALSYLNDAQDNYIHTFKDGDYVYSCVALDVVNIMDINGLPNKGRFLAPDNFINSRVQTGVHTIDALDACDNIFLRDFGIVPESDPDIIRVGTKYFPVDSSSPLMIGVRFG